MGRLKPLRVLLVSLSVLSLSAWAEEPVKKVAKDAELKKKETSITPDKSLAGDITRKKETKNEAPTLKYDAFRTQLEGQVRSKRVEQIKDLTKIIELSQDPKEKPGLLFRLGELYWEESKYYFFEANKKDDDKINAMNRNDTAGVERAEAEKQEILAQSKEAAQTAVQKYSEIVQQYKDYERTDEVLYFLGLNLMEMNDEKRAILAYNRLIEKFPKSKYLPDAFLARAEYYFNNSKGKRDQLEKALDNYKSATKYPENAVYGYALYKMGWCFFNMADYDKAQEQFKAVVLYAEFAGDDEVEGPNKGKKGKGNKQGLAKEARNDYVSAYSRAGGAPNEAKDHFSKLTKKPDELRIMMKKLASLYYDDGKDKEAALTFDMLIKEQPTALEAPGFQAKIIDCVMRAGNKRMTVQQVRRMVKLTDDVTKANPKPDQKGVATLAEAKELSERTISNLAVNWHNEAKKTRDDETFGFANEVYADYLTLFPENPKAYDLRFFWAELLNDNLFKFDQAAQEYTRVILTDVAHAEKGEKTGKWMNNAAYNSILAWTDVIKKLEAEGKLKPPAAEAGKKAEIPPEKKSLLEACERYLKYVEKGDKKVEIAYKAAKIYYDYNWLDEAVSRFSEIALKSPDHKFEDGQKAGEIAANLVLDSYNILGNWEKVNEWARKFYAEDKLAVGKFRDDLAKLIEQSAFKIIGQAEAKNDYAKAADAYMTFGTEFPKSELADKALFNASIAFFKARMLDKAIDVRKQIIQKYPKSQYVPQTMFALAEGFEAIADFDNAADYYEAYASNYEKSRGGAPAKKGKAAKGAPKKDDAPKESTPGEQVWEESKAQDALFNAGIFRDGLGQMKAALKDRETYLALWPESKDAEAVTKSIIDLNERSGAYPKATKGIEEYEKKFVKDPNKVLWGEGRLASIYEDKQKNARAARGIYIRILDYYEKLPKRQKDTLEIAALDAVARANFVMSEDDWKKYDKLKLRWSVLTNIGELKGSIGSKAKGLEEIQKVYTKTVSFKSADPAICALHKIGLAYDQFASALENPPQPKGITEELLLEVKSQFAEQAKPIKDKATEAFTAVVQKSQELDVFNGCTTAALDMLRTKYKPEQFPKMYEDVLEMKVDDKKQMAIGQDVLTAIQSVPVVSSEKAKELRAKAKEVGRDVADLSNSPPPDAEESPPPKAQQKSNGSKSAPAPAPKAAPKKQESSDEEPQ